MSALRRGALVALVVSTLLLGGCAWSLVHRGELREDRLEELWQASEVARSLPRPDDVPARVFTRDEIDDHVRRLMAEDWSRDELADYEDSLVAIGVWPADRDLETETVVAASEEIEGFYAPTDRALYVAADSDLPFSIRFASALSRRDIYREQLLTHEMMHAIQHRAYPWLLEVGMSWKDQDDVSMALRTAIEGDATHFGLRALMDLEALPAPSRFQQHFDGELDAPERESARSSPLLLELGLRLPYVQGYRLAYTERDALLEDPPISTEQVLHPLRRHDPFTSLDLAALHPLLPEGCRVTFENTLGEFGISVLLRDLGEDWPPASEGWDGDRYLAARCGERRAFLWITLWDTADDAREFAETYALVAEAARERAGLEAPPVSQLQGREVYVATGPLEPLAAELPRRARRTRVAGLAALRAHAEGGATPVR